VLSNGNLIQISEMIAQQIAGETIGCSVLVNDRGALTRKYFSIEVPASAAPALPAVSAPTVALQDPSNKTVKVTLAIPSIQNYNPTVMKITLQLAGTDCDKTVIEAVPNQLLCTGLAGNTNYSPSLKIAYQNSRINQSNTSPVATFKTDQLIPLTEAPDRVSAEQKEGGAVAYVGDQVDCPTDKGVRKLIESDLSRKSYTICWPADALAAWEAGGRTWTNFLTKKKFNAPIPPVPILLEQIMATDFSGGLSLKFSVPEIPGFNPDTMGLDMSVVGTNVSGSGPSPLPGTTLTFTMIGPELDYTATLMIWCKSSCAPSQTRLELFGPGLKFRTIKNTWVPTDIDPPIVTVYTPSSIADYKAVMPAAGPTSTTVGVRYALSDDVLVNAAALRFIKSDGTVVVEQNNSTVNPTRTSALQIQKVVIPPGSANIGEVLTIQVRATDATGKSSPWTSVGTFTIAADIPDYPTIDLINVTTPISPVATSGSGGQGRVGSTITTNFVTFASRGSDGIPTLKLVTADIEIPLTITSNGVIGYQVGGTRTIRSANFTIPQSVVVGTTYTVKAQITDYYDYKSVWTDIGTLTVLPPYTP
jgi:hypothetical protein